MPIFKSAHSNTIQEYSQNNQVEIDKELLLNSLKSIAGIASNPVKVDRITQNHIDLGVNIVESEKQRRLYQHETTINQMNEFCNSLELETALWNAVVKPTEKEVLEENELYLRYLSISVSQDNLTQIKRILGEFELQALDSFDKTVWTESEFAKLARDSYQMHLSNTVFVESNQNIARMLRFALNLIIRWIQVIRWFWQTLNVTTDDQKSLLLGMKVQLDPTSIPLCSRKIQTNPMDSKETQDVSNTQLVNESNESNDQLSNCTLDEKVAKTISFVLKYLRTNDPIEECSNLQEALESCLVGVQRIREKVIELSGKCESFARILKLIGEVCQYSSSFYFRNT